MASTCPPATRGAFVINGPSSSSSSSTWSVGGKGGLVTCRGGRELVRGVTEGPSCLYVGPLETASQETLEALYLQARDAYYSGKPLIVDDMFDRVELKLRWYGSKSVVKYPRCSLRRHSTYSDAEGRKIYHKLLHSQVYGSSFSHLAAQHVLYL